MALELGKIKIGEHKAISLYWDSWNALLDAKYVMVKKKPHLIIIDLLRLRFEYEDWEVLPF